jgi:imidazolonepropionase-like amidohydrolase
MRYRIRRFPRLVFRMMLYFCGAVALLIIAATAFYTLTIYPAGPAHQGYTVLTRATVLVGENLEPRTNSTVVIKDGQIMEIGATDVVRVPSEASVFDVGGCVVLPGLIDLHVHLGSPALKRGQKPGLLAMPKLILDWMRYFPDRRRALLEHGVTTVRSLGDDYEWVTEFRKMIRDHELEGPNIFVAGPLFTTTNGHPVTTLGVDPESGGIRVPSTPEGARRAVRALAVGERAVDLIKVVQERGRGDGSLAPLKPEVLRAIVAEAHSHGLPVTAHWGTPEDLQDVLDAGVDSLEHLEPRGVPAGWPTETLEIMVKRGLPLSPTLIVTDTVISPAVMERLQTRVREYHTAGGPVTVGSDAGMPSVAFGAGVHRELELLVASGLKPREALRGATSESARVLKSERVGVIAPKRIADLLVVSSNPLEDISALRRIMMVFREGRVVVDRRKSETIPNP